MVSVLKHKKILLIISGGIAAYKSLELIRLIRKAGGDVRCILTGGGAQFVTPLSVSALSENHVYTDLWSLKDEREMGHIRLSREADVILIAPASANILAQMTYGLADDLASTTLLAADKDIIVAPAMNHMMWSNAATQDNINVLKSRRVRVIEPATGDMACGEHGAGRMVEPEDIFDYLETYFLEQRASWGLQGKKVLVTAGPTYEPIDPVRFIGNRSSGKQGYAIAVSLAEAGADVTLVSGPVALSPPEGLTFVPVQTAREMEAACLEVLPVDIAICAAAVSDWGVEGYRDQKIKKGGRGVPPSINLKENPDILHGLSQHKSRPSLVIGFAAETENMLEHARQKRTKKGCDWILANDVSGNVFGSDENHVYLITNQTEEDWGAATKQQVAQRLVQHIAEYFKDA